MANNGKFVTLESGRQKQELALAVSAGAADASKIIRTDVNGKLDSTFLPVGLGTDSRPVIAFEALSAGNMVNVFDNGGTLNMRKADPTTAGKEANGFVNAAVAATVSGICVFEGTVSSLSGLTIGARYYLSLTAGAITTVPLSASGNVHQYIGTALSATELTFEPDDGIILA